MNDSNIQIFQDSLERCLSDPLFLDRFYELLISNSEEIKAYFRNTEMSKQKQMLSKSLSYMVIAHQNPEHLAEVARIHNAKNLNVDPRLYSDWLDCMIDTVQLTDTQFNEQIEQAWKQIMQSGIDYMASKYDE